MVQRADIAAGKPTAPPSTEPLKKAVTGAMRAMAGEAELEVTFVNDRPSLSGHRARLPDPPRKMTAHDIAVTRGLGDSVALRLACHDDGVHRDLLPEGPKARAVFEAVEQARCEALGARVMPGVASNLTVMLEDRYFRANLPQLASRDEVPLEDALALMVRERLTGTPPPMSAGPILRAWKGWIEERAGDELAKLDGKITDQRAFARAVRHLLVDLEMGDEVGGDPEDDEEQEGREGEQQDQRAGDGEDTATEEVAKRQEDASGDEQETGET